MIVFGLEMAINAVFGHESSLKLLFLKVKQL
jgi:hypothetical protein